MGIWLWCVSPGWGVNHLLLILSTIIFCPGVGNLIIFLENVKIPTLCPNPHPLGLDIDGCITFCVKKLLHSALTYYILRQCYPILRQYYIFRWSFLHFALTLHFVAKRISLYRRFSITWETEDYYFNENFYLNTLNPYKTQWKHLLLFKIVFILMSLREIPAACE